MSLSSRCASCAGCPEISAPKADPLSVLRRLPEALFNLNAPSGDFVPELLAGDPVTDLTIFGPLGQDDTTPQYELARIFAEEKARFILGWRTAEALQLGLGVMTEGEAGVVSNCPHAAGVDLDRVGAQFGVGRPMGFTDCCYWRLVQLLLFTPGPTTWRLLEIAELYTGTRPDAVERPAAITLRWPQVPTGATFWRESAPDDVDQHYNHGARWSGPSPANPYADTYWRDGVADDVDAFWSVTNARSGLSLLQALKLAKPAGVFVDFENLPTPGIGGCLGATLRAEGAGRLAHWA